MIKPKVRKCVCVITQKFADVRAFMMNFEAFNR